ncbi:hypothetical protein B0H21DRAFT_252060 [Amylocystis lapponica]|nr:hypothetical protein B0H21DRAFT_252060 [Amylocystis lapponica]
MNRSLILRCRLLIPFYGVHLRCHASTLRQPSMRSRRLHVLAARKIAHRADRTCRCFPRECMYASAVGIQLSNAGLPESSRARPMASTSAVYLRADSRPKQYVEGLEARLALSRDALVYRTQEQAAAIPRRTGFDAVLLLVAEQHDGRGTHAAVFSPMNASIATITDAPPEPDMQNGKRRRRRRTRSPGHMSSLNWAWPRRAAQRSRRADMLHAGSRCMRACVSALRCTIDSCAHDQSFRFPEVGGP